MLASIQTMWRNSSVELRRSPSGRTSAYRPSGETAPFLQWLVCGGQSPIAVETEAGSALEIARGAARATPGETPDATRDPTKTRRPCCPSPTAGRLTFDIVVWLFVSGFDVVVRKLFDLALPATAGVGATVFTACREKRLTQ